MNKQDLYIYHMFSSSDFSKSELTVNFILIKDEILEVAGKIYKAGMSLLVIDTENKFVSTGFAKEIARVAQGLCTTILLNPCIICNRKKT